MNRNNVRKSLVACAAQLAGGLLLKKLNYFGVMLTFFNSRGCEEMYNFGWSMQVKFFEFPNHISRLT